MPFHDNYKVATHTRINDGTSSDLSQLLATRPGWVLSVQAFNISSAGAASLFLYDTTASVTTTSVPIWQGMIPFAGVATTSNSIGGAGFIVDLTNGLTLNNGLAYAVSSGAAPASLSTFPTSLVKVNIQYVTSSCL